MTAKEIMVGDWVECVDSSHEKKAYAQIDSIEEGQTCILVRFDNCNWFLDISFIKPIPITGEILEKNGFKEVNKGYGSWSLYKYKYDGCTKTTQCHIFWSKTEAYLKIISYTYEFGDFERIGIQYVHELQHALRLCGIETEINV